jgi:hypothetical protein
MNHLYITSICHIGGRVGLLYLIDRIADRERAKLAVLSFAVRQQLAMERLLAEGRE